VTNPTILPTSLHPLSVPIVLLSNRLTPVTFSGYALPYAGLTGDAFFPSSWRAREITSIKRPHVAPPSCMWCPWVITGPSCSTSYRHSPLHIVDSILTLAGRTFGIKFVSIHSPCSVAPRTCSLGSARYGCNGIFRNLVLRRNCGRHVSTISIGFLHLTVAPSRADALYVCYCLDREVDTQSRQDVFDAVRGCISWF
jgi:hypothetical protein